MPVICQLMLYAAIVTLNGSGLYLMENLALCVFYRVTCAIYICGTPLLNITKLHFWMHPKDLEMKYQISFNTMLFFTKPSTVSSSAFVVKLSFSSLITEYYLLILKALWTNYILAYLIKYFLQNYSLSPPVIFFFSSVHTVPSCIIYPQYRKLSQCKSILCFLKRGHE